MSDQTPPDPYGTPAEEPQQPAYGQPNPYETAPPMGGYGMQPAAYSPWIKRVGAALVDQIIMAVPYYALFFIGQAVGGTAGTLLVVLGYLALIGVFVWNVCLQGGRTGYTVGKGLLGIKLINEQTGQPIGAAMAFARSLLHVVDSLPCLIGYLWPLWDAKRQTFADKLVSTVVIDQPKG